MLSPQFVHMIVCLSITSIAQIGMNGFQSKFVGSWTMVKQRNDSILEVIWPSCHATCAIFPFSFHEAIQDDEDAKF